MTATQEPALTGSCMCGKVTYSSTSLPNSLTNCYCQTCRRLSGSPFITFGQFNTSAISWTSGKDSFKTTSYSDLATRTHCSECGSPISMQYNCDQGEISITAGTINEDSIKGKLPKLKQHIFVGSMDKAGWYQIPKDDVIRHSKFSTSFQKMLDEWKEAMLKSGGLG